MDALYRENILHKICLLPFFHKFDGDGCYIKKNTNYTQLSEMELIFHSEFVFILLQQLSFKISFRNGR